MALLIRYEPNHSGLSPFKWQLLDAAVFTSVIIAVSVEDYKINGAISETRNAGGMIYLLLRQVTSTSFSSTSSMVL